MPWDVAPTCDLVTQAFACTDYPEWWTDQCPSRYYHDGIDISAWSGSCGKRLNATRPGRVAIVGTVPGQSGLGDRALVIDAAEAVHILYGHCERVHVAVGDHVEPGQHVADIGTRGYSDGCHVHFAVKQWGALSWTPPAGCLDPVPYMTSVAVPEPAPPPAAPVYEFAGGNGMIAVAVNPQLPTTELFYIGADGRVYWTFFSGVGAPGDPNWPQSLVNGEAGQHVIDENFKPWPGSLACSFSRDGTWLRVYAFNRRADGERHTLWCNERFGPSGAWSSFLPMPPQWSSAAALTP
jgi:murein DD-endopeptidase MepM/ murein hydrolase activator NlpD